MSKKNFTCFVCDLKFSSEQALNQHCNATNHVKPSSPKKNLEIQCPHCTKKFDSEQARIQHIAIKHSKTTKIKCTLCNKEFNTQEAMEQHKKAKHKTQEKEKCPHCGNLIQKSSLSKHIKKKHTVKKQKPIQKCPYCEEQFPNLNQILNHISKFHGFKCPHCSERFHSQEFVKLHTENHHKDKIITGFFCDLCKTEFRTEKKLTHHMIDIHYSGKITFLHPKNEDKKLTKQRESLWERFRITRQHKEKVNHLLPHLTKKIIIMDECVGNDTTVIDALSDSYTVKHLPKELKGKSDEHLRLVFEDNGWGLVSLDREMVLKAREMNIEPVFLIIQKKNTRDLINYSNGTYRLK